MKTMLTISLGCLICFAGGLYLGVSKVEEQTTKWDVRYKDTDDKVSAYIKVSDPKTVRFYVKQLNDLLDNMTRLGKIIESGQKLDEALIDILNEQQKINEQLDKMITREEYTGAIESATHQRQGFAVDLDDLYDMGSDNEDDLKLIDKNILNKLNTMQTDLDTIRGLIKDIQDSKIGKKIFK